MEVERIEELYQKYKTEWGRVTFEDFKKMMHEEFSIVECKTNDRIIRFIFEALDGEGFFNFNDGRLNIDEFKAILSFFPAKFEYPYADLVTILFKILDRDGNRYLDVKEIEHFFKKIDNEVPDLISKVMMENFDNNQDGVMQFDEFIEFIKLDTY